MNKTVDFSDGSFLEYGKGKFDNWCVYLTRPSQGRCAPKDFQYFQSLREYGDKYGCERVYKDFISIYDRTDKQLESSVFDFIKELSNSYVDDALDISIIFSIIYMGMVAEENKAYTKLGKRVKRLGIHQVLIDNMSCNDAANFSRNKPWKELDELCQSKKF